MSYASRTKVPVSRSRAELEQLLRKYEATEFLYGERDSSVVVEFGMKDRRVRFAVPLAGASSTGSEQENRERWRALVLAIKAKIVSVAAGVETFEEAFLAHVVMDNDQTVWERYAKELPSKKVQALPTGVRR